VGRVQEAFNNNFFDLWACHILVIEDYSYSGINFLRDPDIPMPPRKEHGDIGKHIFKFI
jgi:hypothetical protein